MDTLDVYSEPGPSTTPTSSGVTAACLPAYFEAYDAYTQVTAEKDTNHLLCLMVS